MTIPTEADPRRVPEHERTIVPPKFGLCLCQHRTRTGGLCNAPAMIVLAATPLCRLHERLYSVEARKDEFVAGTNGRDEVRVVLVRLPVTEIAATSLA
ncbi:MAG TPA: hypothetical protein VFG22_01950 [Polyangiales bacterium]|nr:hypothetical protein [Polyangiales bacterium]